jgi:hypothetical protein
LFKTSGAEPAMIFTLSFDLGLGLLNPLDTEKEKNKGRNKEDL